MKTKSALGLLILLTLGSILDLEAKRTDEDNGLLSQTNIDPNDQREKNSHDYFTNTNESDNVSSINTNDVSNVTRVVEKRKIVNMMRKLPLNIPDTKVPDPKQIEPRKIIADLVSSAKRKTDDIDNSSIHVKGRILLSKIQSSAHTIVQYEMDSIGTTNNNNSSIQSRLSFTEDFISKKSAVILYVSTSKTIDRNSALSKFQIKNNQENFPLSFHIRFKLPNDTKDDTTLYFFVFITDNRKHIDAFIPAGTSRILLRETNRLEQKLDVYVKANGIKITGSFQDRYGQQTIGPNTVFQVAIIPEGSLRNFHNESCAKVALLTLKNVTSSYPISFDFLLLHQALNPDEKYYAVGFVTENGIRRSIKQEPILVMNESKVLVTSEVVFNVIPSPFILYGMVTRLGSGALALQPRSSLVLKIHEIDTNSDHTILKLTNVISLPIAFRLDLSHSNLFDASKSYNMNAFIIDEFNSTYMTNTQQISLMDNYENVIVPVDDVLYYIKVELQSLWNPKYNFLPGSKARIYVTEDPNMTNIPEMSFVIDPIPKHFHEFWLKLPVANIKPDHDYFLVMFIEINGLITHRSRTYLTFKNQISARTIQMAIPSLNTTSGIIVDIDNRAAQWSSSSYVTLALFDERLQGFNHTPVQTWDITLENNFPIRFEVQIDFGRLHPTHTYVLQAIIQSKHQVLEYVSVSSEVVWNPHSGVLNNIHIPMQRVKSHQSVEGLISLINVNLPLADESEIVIQVSSSPSLTQPNIIDELSIKLNECALPVNFTMSLSLNKINVNSIYYFLARYVVRNNTIIPATEAFAFTPRNETQVILTLSKPLQTVIKGSVTSTNNTLILPSNVSLHLYISDSVNHTQNNIYSEVFFRTSSNNRHDFRMHIDQSILEKEIPLYLHSSILYKNNVIIRMPKPALLQITPDSEWNINLIIDLPTILIGKIVTKSKREINFGGFDVQIEILENNTTNIVNTSQFQIQNSQLPKNFFITIDNDMFKNHSTLRARAFIKTCQGYNLFEPANAVDIHQGFNTNIDLPVVLTNHMNLQANETTDDYNTSLHIGVWRLSVTGVTNLPSMSSKKN